MTKQQREALKTRRAATATKPKCRHCAIRVIGNGTRGLCKNCYSRLDIRAQYSPHGTREDEPTEEQIEAMIRERMRKLPKWWHKETV